LLGRVRVANKFPDVEARMQPSDSLASFDRGFGSPRRRPTSWGRRLFVRLTRWPGRAPANARASEMDHRLSVIPETPEERQGPPGLLGRPLPACRGATHPAGHDHALPLLLFEKIYGEAVVLQDFLTPGHPG